MLIHREQLTRQPRKPLSLRTYGPHRIESEPLDYDPWESFNERTFSFNFKCSIVTG